MSQTFRDIPSIDELLDEPQLRMIAEEAGRSVALSVAREAANSVRTEIGRSGATSASGDSRAAVLAAASAIWARDRRRGVQRVINATGVVIHTNLGRSALPDRAVEAFGHRAARYCTLEYDIETGKRGKRGEWATRLICELTGAESAAIVNNCAAAAFLVLRTLAAGKEVIISRGELVEIGGDFRVPDVLLESGAVLREVGTTNRTKLNDYKKAINANTGLILRVHPSNYRVIGFTEAPSNRELATLARDASLPFFEDAGSGAIVDLSAYGLADEPLISRSIEDGADIVAFSGDKLLGGVQAGFIVGKSEYIEKVRRHPLYRALRVDKIAYAAIEAVIHSYLSERHLEDIPTLRMLSMEPEEIKVRAEKLSNSVQGRGGDSLTVEIIEGESVIGGGSAPDLKPRTWLIAISIAGLTADEIDQKLRSLEPPVIARISDDRVVLDLRTVFEDEENTLIEAINSLA